MAHAKLEREGHIAPTDIGIQRGAIGFAVGGMHMFAPRDFIAAKRTCIKSEHCLDGRRDIEIIARNIPVPHAHARAGESESVALLAAQRADIGAAAAALRVIGGGEGKKREGCGEDTARKRSEERRVGKECRWRWSPQTKKKKKHGSTITR